MDVDTPWGEVWLEHGGLGRGVRGGQPGPRTTRPVTRSATRCWRSSWTSCHEDADPEVAAPLAARNEELLRRSTAPGRCSRRPTSSATSGTCRRTCGWPRPVSPPRRSACCGRADPHAWTTSDLPLLDAARLRIGDPGAGAGPAAGEAALAEQREQMDERGRPPDRRRRLETAGSCRAAAATTCRRPDRHLRRARGRHRPARRTVRPHRRGRGPGADRRPVADAARRCPSRSFTVVGDRAQARHGFEGTWTERLARAGLDQVTRATLT